MTVGQWALSCADAEWQFGMSLMKVLIELVFYQTKIGMIIIRHHRSLGHKVFACPVW